VLPDGRIAVSSGQGGRRALFYVDPEWLMQKLRSDDFSQGLDGWSVFKPFGPAEGWWRNRTQGARLIDHPDHPGAKALHLRRPDDKPADGATWNFPAAPAGRLSIKFMLPQGSTGGSVALVDRFFDPTDDAGETEAMFHLPLAPGMKIGEQTLSAGAWHTLSLAWDGSSCKLAIDGADAGVRTFAKPSRNGVSYLRLRSTAGSVDEAGWLVERVEASAE
jgi:hypothetical protein